MAYQDKLEMVKSFLRSGFPASIVEDEQDSEYSGHGLKMAWQGSTYYTIVTNDFLDRFEASDIPVQLASFTLIEHLKELPDTPIIVSKSGLKLLYD